MATLSLKIRIDSSGQVKTMQFEPSLLVFDACHFIRQKVPEANKGNPQEFGLFLSDEDPKKGVWLDNSRSLEYYLLRNGDILDYKSKLRIIKVKMLDGAVKTLQVDDSYVVSQLMVVICSRIGITNHDEYSLIYETAEEKDNMSTLKKQSTIARRERKKMDEMKKKLQTDDELNWLDHGKTLREQSVTEGDTLLLKRKLFFSDQNIDARDPIQLNLLYVQMRDAILNGAHPVSQAEAIQFAGFQCHIQFGLYVETKHKPGFLELKEFLPKEYVKSKNIEKMIFQEHRQLYGLNEVEAKVRYTQLARSLKTYGITFFLVKERMKSSKKLALRLFGVNKVSIVRIDEKTKEVLQTWPLTHVKRWAASPNSFNLDFGDHDVLYSVQTSEGEQISALIAGYIDIILKRKREKDHFGLDGDEESTMLEESVTPAKATIIQHQSSNMGHASMESVAMPGVIRNSQHGPSSYQQWSMGNAQYGTVQNQSNIQHIAPSSRTGHNSALHAGLNQSQRALLGTINSAITGIQNAENEIDSRPELPPLGDDAASRKWRENTFDVSKQNVNSQLSAVNAATAQIINLTSGSHDETDNSGVGSAVHTISSNMHGLTKDVKMLAALKEEEGRNGRTLLDAARKMTGALSDLLNAAQPDSKEPRTALLGAATKVGEASGDIMRDVGYDEEDSRYEDALLALAKAVANATANLVLRAKAVANNADEQALQNKVISMATQCALATSQLVSCTKVAAPTIYNPACQEQVVDAAKLVAKTVEGVVQTSQEACHDDRLLGELSTGAQLVTQALNALLSCMKHGGAADEDTVDAILSATNKLFNSMGDAPEMVKQARSVAQATSSLVNSIKGEAMEHSDSDMQKRLLGAAQALADATYRMVEAAKGCAGNPNDSNQQQSLRSAAEDLRSATNAAAQNALKKKQLQLLESAARQACSAATQLGNASEAAAHFNRNQPSQQELSAQCKQVNEHVLALFGAMRDARNHPESAQAVRTLIDSSKALLQPGGKMCSAAKAAVPTIGDQAAQLSVSNATRGMGVALSELRTAAANADEVCGGMQIEGAIEQVKGLQSELRDTRQAAVNGALMPLPGETSESTSLQLGQACKSMGASMAALLTAAAQGNEEYTCNASLETVGALKHLASAVRGVCATTPNRDTDLALIDSGSDVLDKSGQLLEEANRVLRDPNNRDNQMRLAQVAKAVSLALNSCVSCLPGQRDIDNVLKTINNSQNALAASAFPPADGRSYATLQDSLVGSAGELNAAAADIVSAARGTPQQLASSSNVYSNSYVAFIEDGMTVAGASKDTEAQQLIVGGLKGVSLVSSKLLLAAKSLHSDPSAPNAKNLLAQAARNVTESINSLIDTCTTAAPGQKECDSALREIQAASTLLDTPNEPVNDNSYFQCLDAVMERSGQLGQSMTGIATYSREGNMESFCVSVRQFSMAVCTLTESAAQSAYLVGIADKASEPGKPGLVDQSQFSRANQAIQQACQTLASSTSSQSQVLSAATVVAKHTSALCNACRKAAGKTNNPVAKRQFVMSAKDVANSTASLVKSIKTLDGDFTPHNKQLCAEASRPLIEAVEKLTNYGSSPEFASIPARISKEVDDPARRAQEPIIAAGRQMIESSCKMVTSAKKLAGTPRDPSIYQTFSGHSKTFSDAMKKLITSIKESAPGQRESDQAIDSLQSWVKDLDAAGFAAMSQSLVPREDNSLEGFQEQVINSCKEIMANIDPLVSAASSEAEKLGHRTTLITNYFDPLTDGGTGCASKIYNSRLQTAILEQSKAVTESGLQLVMLAKESGGNPNATSCHAAMNEAAECLRATTKDLLTTMEEGASAAGAVTTMIDNISKAIAKTEKPGRPSPNTSFVDYQTSMVQLCKRIAQVTREMVSKSSSPETAAELGIMANTLTKQYADLAEQQQCASAVCSSTEVAARLKARVQDLGNSCIQLVQNAGTVQQNPTDTFAKRDLAENAKSVSEKVSYVMAALQDSSRGTQACINAASVVSGIIGDLDTTIMFATAGTLNSDADKDQFTDHREAILKTAKVLVEDTKTLVAGAASSQEALAEAAQNSVKTITSLAEVVKLGAASIGSDQPEAQVLLINSVKDVASALAELISCTKNAAGKPSNDPSMISLKDSAKVMVTNVTSLLKTVKTVEDEAARGTRALESTIEAMRQEIRAFESSEKVDRVASAEDVIRYTKPLTTATAKTVAAGNSCRQEDVISASNMGRKAVCDLLLVCKAAVQTAENEEVKKNTLTAAKTTAERYLALLQHIGEILQKPGQQNLKAAMRDLSMNVAHSVGELVKSCEALKAYGHLSGSDFVDPDDPTVIAENELLGAAKSIEAAAKKLMQLKPRASAKEADEDLNFDEQILEACKSIAAATSALVKSASAAQRELVSQGRMSMSFNRYMPDEDGQWSQGLISAARMVAAATHSLCEAANAMVQGHASEEQLISSAKQVAGSTAQLLVACKVKADPDSVAMKRLQAAGNAVKRATEALVRSAQQVKEREDEANVQVNKRMVGGVAQLIDVQAEVLEREKELQRAREKLAALRKEKYKHLELDASDRMF